MKPSDSCHPRCLYVVCASKPHSYCWFERDYTFLKFSVTLRCLYSCMCQCKYMQAACALYTSSFHPNEVFFFQARSNYAGWRSKKPIRTFSLSPPSCLASPAKGVSATVAHHILNIHQGMILSPATNATGRQVSFQLSLKSRFLSLKLQI